jgi:hypothetical protein
MQVRNVLGIKAKNTFTASEKAVFHKRLAMFSQLFAYFDCASVSTCGLPTEAVARNARRDYAPPATVTCVSFSRCVTRVVQRQKCCFE